MKLYEINKEIESCVDSETGEIIDVEKLSELQIERDLKIENIALWIKDLKAESEAIKAEKTTLSKREDVIKNKIESLSNYLSYVLNGEKFSTGKVALSFRHSVSTEIDDENIIPKKYFKRKVTFSVDRTAIKNAIQAGIKVKGAHLSENSNIQIK